MTALSINLNKVALLRNARAGEAPDLAQAARTALAAGADGITVHPRPDQRHIRPGDVIVLSTLLRRINSQATASTEAVRPCEFNIEGNPFAGPRDNGYPGFDRLIESAHPDQATLVPDSDRQLTSDHGFDLAGDNDALADKIAAYQALGARVSLFMDPDPAQIARAASLGADRVELYTGPFAETVAQHGPDHADSRASLAVYRAAAQAARAAGLGVNAGHDLDLTNLPLFRSLGDLDEVSIGHAVIVRALEAGLAETVRAFRRALDGETCNPTGENP